jgi:hypothetical protein
MDLFLDRQLPESETIALEDHLDTCDECRAILANRRVLRARVRSAIRNDEAPSDLGHRVQFAVARAGTPRRLPVIGFAKPVLALAASVVIATSAYYFWPERDTPPRETQAEFIERAIRPLTPLMRVGFQQHLHCGVFREYPALAPALADLAHDRSVSPALIDAVETHAPAGLHVALAHRCSYKNRQYIHIVARGDGHLMSLLITKRREAEDFASDLKDAAAKIDLPVFATGAQAGQDTYSIDAFEASGYVVFLVSDSSPAENLHTLEAMAAQVRAALI